MPADPSAEPRMSDAASPALHAADPSARLECHFRQRWAAPDAADTPRNPALGVEVFGCVRHRGDWLAVVVTPGFLKLVLLAGGGDLWGDIPTGQRRYVELPWGTLPFVAEDEPDLGPFQSCQLVEPISAVADMAAARTAALDVLRALVPPPPPPAETTAPAPDNSRRGFFRRLAGKR